MRRNEYGRSMVEMLGVLGVIGVISVGGYNIVGKSISSKRNTQIIVDAANLASSAKKLACQYDEGYADNSYSEYLYTSEAYPKELRYSSSDGFIGVNEVTYKLEYSMAATDNDSDYFNMIIGGVDQEECIRIASSDWGTPLSSGFVGLSVGTTNEKEYITGCGDSCTGKNNVAVAGTESYPLSKGNATNACGSASNNSIQLWYKGCR